MRRMKCCNFPFTIAGSHRIVVSISDEKDEVLQLVQAWARNNIVGDVSISHECYNTNYTRNDAHVQGHFCEAASLELSPLRASQSRAGGGNGQPCLRSTCLMADNRCTIGVS